MAAYVDGVFDKSLQEKIQKTKILVVGAGGIGCEVLKNLVLTGFHDIEVIDLDTIDVSNLNRQFLFHREHVGLSKAIVAKESVGKFNPKAQIVAHHDSIISKDYSMKFFQKFDVVLNALDNRQARNHVNRMCLAADVPLVDSGTSGFSGQVELIKKSTTKCYECEPKPPAKTYPSCTIRNTPSELIHCIVWAKHLFNQLFGEEDADNEVSPDATDEAESISEEAESISEEADKKEKEAEKISTRQWAQKCQYYGGALFNKLFFDDVKYLLKMKHLWEKRRAPVPIDFKALPDDDMKEDGAAAASKEMEVWSVPKCAKVFVSSVSEIKKEFMGLPEGSVLSWDKDQESYMDFVAAAANIRAQIFGIPTKSRFEVKSMAGNIIPAIATSNAIIAGLLIMHALKVLQGRFQDCQSVYLRVAPNHRGRLIVPERKLMEPNPNCRVCSSNPQVVVAVDMNKMSCKQFENLVLKNALNMVAPDLSLASTGNVLISSEEGETSHNDSKTLSEMGLVDSSLLEADDFLQNFTLSIVLIHRESEPEGSEYELLSKVPQPEPENGKHPEGEPSNSNAEVESDDDMMIIEGEEVAPRKRKHDDEDSIAKKRRTESDLPEIVL